MASSQQPELFSLPRKVDSREFSPGDTDIDMPTSVSPPSRTRDYYLALNRCRSLVDVSNLARERQFHPIPYTDGVVGDLSDDDVAQAYLPSDVPEGRTPVTCRGDGNCLFRAASLCVTGRQGLHIELRCRVAMELILNAKRYVDDNYLRLGRYDRDYAHKPSDVYWWVSSRSDRKCSLEAVVAVGKYTREAKKYSCAYSMIALTNVLERPVCSVYPEDIRGSNRKDFNRLFLPYNPRFRARKPIFMMWTPSFEGHSVNHVVPLLEP
jgi:hypothetical protein